MCVSPILPMVQERCCTLELVQWVVSLLFARAGVLGYQRSPWLAVSDPWGLLAGPIGVRNGLPW